MAGAIAAAAAPLAPALIVSSRTRLFKELERSGPAILDHLRHHPHPRNKNPADATLQVSPSHLMGCTAGHN